MTASTSAAIGHDDLGRGVGAGGERLRQQLLALDRLDLVAVGVALREPGVEVRRPSAITSSSAAVPIHTRRGLRATRSPTLRQVPWVSSAPVSPKCGTPLLQPKIGGRQNAPRPVMASMAGSSVSIVIIATAMPIAPIGPRPAVPFDLGDRQAQQRGDDRAAGGEDRGPGGAHGQRDGLVLVLVLAQLLAVARDEQQRVVGARAQHEHGEDRGRLAVDGHAQLGQP